MSCRGMHFSLRNEDVERLMAAKNDREVLDFVQKDIEARWDEENLVASDKAWDAIHRCLTDGTLKCKNNDTKEKMILGGKQLYKGNDYIISFKDTDEVREVFKAIKGIEKDWFSSKFYNLKKKFFWFSWSQYDGPLDENDFEYTWSYFLELRGFFKKVSEHNQTVIFIVDQ
ncbi:MAG: hypothetical protein CSA35_06690 [Dethiosulfovibrio peptidovorans]|nr:MAG: hypothetical protein CSA35_06690 [Dethiosulfovibrio peptidovorans]